MAACKNCFAPEVNEKEVVALLEKVTPGSTKKATKYGVFLVTIIPLALVGYEMIIANERSWNN